MHLISWNVNGIRAAVKKGFHEFVEKVSPDFLCLQETKAQDDQVAETLQHVEGYSVISSAALRKGYSGTAILCKNEPISVTRGIGIDPHDQEGRVLSVELEHFHLVNVYVPNSGNSLVRLDYRRQWDKDFLAYLKQLETKKPVIVCGDFNVAHQEIDIARPKQNYNKTAGYTQTEIDGFSNFLAAEFIDTFRHQHANAVAYSWWSYRAGARAKNIGWRIDYFIVSSGLINRVEHADILPEIMGSDHCPVSLDINFD